MNIFNHFKHLNLSQGQETALTKLEAFLASTLQVFMLKGYAGSGKTTILQGLVEYLEGNEKQVVLMAPTGRAAKVIRERTGKEAFTIHKSIYSYDNLEEVQEGESFRYHFKIGNNTDVYNNIFIVDEASMLSDAKSEGEFFRFGTDHLLSDLITYTRVQQSSVYSKIIFVGDPCQLPPVTDSSSKAFDAEYLLEKFGLASDQAEMKEVKRQHKTSGITKAAMRIRRSLSSGFFNDFNLSENGCDLFNPPYGEFMDAYHVAENPKIIIASKNKTCLDLNLAIREQRYGTAGLPMQITDIVIMGGNNYRKGIFNGEFAVINSVSPNTESRTIYLKGKEPVTLTWRNVELIFPEKEDEHKVVTGKVIENFLYGDNYLKPEETRALYVDFLQRHPGLKKGTEQFKDAIMKDEYFNCLRLKYGYAVTCHKAQGGEWQNVFTVWDHDNTEDFNYIDDAQTMRGKTHENFYRWAYTAVTRATGKLYALNPPCFSSYSRLTFVDPGVLSALDELTGANHRPEEISLDNELLQDLSRLKLTEQPLPMQDHLIKVRQVVRKQYIDISGWEKKNFEIIYRFEREGNKAALKTWINGELKFNGKWMIQPFAGSDQALAVELEGLLKHLPEIIMKRDTTETIIGQINFDIETEEKRPFTKNLFDDMQKVLSGTAISIEEPEHLQYKERYTFKRNGEIAMVDFEYDGKGFFGRVVPLTKKCNSNVLLEEIRLTLNHLNQLEHAS